MNARPATLQEVATWSDSLAEFGRHLRDWLHELRRASSRPQAEALFKEEPPLLRDRFAGGQVADAWLAAYAEHLAGSIGREAPAWAFAPERFSPAPLFDEGGDTPTLRMIALARSPLAFKRRNIYTPAVDLPLRLRAGRPALSREQKRRHNAERQRRFRAARRQELLELRRLAARGRSHPEANSG